MTRRLAAALAAYRHLRGPRVLCHEDGRAISPETLRTYVRRAARLANIANDGVHVLRHTCLSKKVARRSPRREERRAKRLTPEELVAIVRKARAATSEEEAKRLEDDFIRGFYGK